LHSIFWPVLLLAVADGVQADSIPYPGSGSYNPITYTFTAVNSGDIIAYFAGTDASHDNQLGLLDNGVLTSAGFGLDDHASSIGQVFDLGRVAAGDTLVFVLHDLTLGKFAYSDPSLNVAYDIAGEMIGHNHVYSTLYTATSPVFPGIPRGLYVAFEDLPFPNSDFSYADENFVFTNVQISSVPEPTSAFLLTVGGTAVAALVWWRRDRWRQPPTRSAAGAWTQHPDSPPSGGS
jgi:hypothetical protein